MATGERKKGVAEMRVEEGMIDSVLEAVTDTTADAPRQRVEGEGARTVFSSFLSEEKSGSRRVMESRHVSVVHTPAEPAAFPASHPPPPPTLARHPPSLRPSVLRTPPQVDRSDVRPL